MRSDTQTITIATPPEEVIVFLADGENLPRWAIGFATSVRRVNDRWMVTTAEAEMPIAIDINEAGRTVDYRMEPAPGVQATAFTRVLPNGDGAEVVFTQFQQPNVADEIFEQLVAAVSHELVTLKALLEVQCPL